jgi:phage shock protein B
MINIIIVSIVFGSIVALAALICGTILIVLKTRSRNQANGAGDQDEAKTIQEIYQGLDRMEQRIESLETILMENKEKEGKNE